MYLGDIFMDGWKGYSKRQKIQVGILFAIWVLFGIANTLLQKINVISQMQYIDGLFAWTLLAAAFAVVTWFILGKKDDQQKDTVKQHMNLL
jgi:predicted outer membrane lipoprotein